MKDVHDPFRITIQKTDISSLETVVHHSSETFDMIYGGNDVSILNNGDNSWSLVKGEIDQETVNLLGTAIEKYFGHR